MHGSDAIRLPGLPGELSQQIAKYDSSEFDDDKEVNIYKLINYIYLYLQYSISRCPVEMRRGCGHPR